VPLPFVSILIPVRNEAAFIKRSLSAALAQDYPSERIEVLVIDANSSDGTGKIVGEISSASKFRIRLLNNPSIITSCGLNHGLRQAEGEVIILVGGHCEIAPDYVKTCVEVLHKTAADCVGGPIVTVGDSGVARVIAIAQKSKFGVGGVRFRTNCATAGYVDTVAFGAYRREVFERIGNFDEDLVRNQDDEFNFRLIQAGGKIWLDPSIHSIYYSRTAFGKLWRQYFEYGAYKVRLIQKRSAVPSLRHLVPAMFLCALVGSLLLALLTHRFVWAWSIAGPYVAANVLASIWSGRRDWRAISILPMAFLILHLAYGTGFLWGIWHWRKHFGRRRTTAGCDSQAA
jgi:glycosyltransferase involved in cell wall biosynthesis